jgi:hypothetical protein
VGFNPVAPTRAAGWRIEPPVSGPGGGGRRGGRPRGPPPARRAARHEGEVPGVVNRAVVARLVRRSHREFVHVGLAEQHRARGGQPSDHRRVVGRDEVVEHARAARSLDAGRAKDVLVGDRQPRQGARVAGRQPAVGRRGLGQSLLRGDGDEGVQGPVEALDPLELVLDELDGREAPRFEILGELGKGAGMHTACAVRQVWAAQRPARAGWAADLGFGVIR